jgi:uncharacterized repeat protein (TIGR01451 family)
MYVRVAGPKGMKVTLYRGFDKGQTFDAPAVVGLRPGYTYRLALSDVPGFPAQVFFPSLEVRGSLLLSPKLRNADFPATLNFAEEDFARVLDGALVKKAIVLERPDAAVAKATTPERPLELLVPPARDPVLEGQARGQPLVVVLMGQRQLSAEELARAGIPGTVLLPGERVLGLPTVAPFVPFTCFPVVDPLLGPRHPAGLVTVFDGGDVGLPAGVTWDGKLRGLDPTDTVAEYTDSRGQKRLAVSNRVGLCIPRFIVLRGETHRGAQIARVGPEAAQVYRGQELFRGRLIVAEETKRVGLEQTGQRLRPSGTANTYGTAIVGRLRGLEMKTTLRAVERVDGVCLKPEAPPAPDRPLLIIKWPDKMGALVGEVVTFYLRFTNQGGQPITHVVVSDNLTTRFEYVPGSAKADREAIFTTQPNDVGSTILRWEFSGALQPRESGIVQFQVRVR